jgi:F-type H+-transporting ATPase subunit b
VALACVWLSCVLLVAAPQEHAEEPTHAVNEATHAEAKGHTNLDLWKWINFALLAAVLGYYLYTRAGGFFSARTSDIRKGLTEAAQVKKEAEARYAEMERRLAGLESDIEALRRRATQESGAEHERIQQEIEREMAKIRAQAEQEIASAAKAARQNLRAYSAELAVGLAEQRIRERMTPEVDDALVQAVTGQIENRPPVRTA